MQEFYKVLEAASTKQQLTRALVRHALQTLPHGFDALDNNLIFHASLVSDAYDKWYRAFAQAVQVCTFPATIPMLTSAFETVPHHVVHSYLLAADTSCKLPETINLHAAHDLSWHRTAILHADDRALAFSHKVYGGEQGNKTAQQLEKDDKEGKVPKEFFNNYTIVSYSDGKYSQVAYADYFKDEIAEIVGLFDSWIAGKPSTCQFCHFL